MKTTQDVLGVAFTENGELITAYILNHECEGTELNPEIVLPFSTLYIGTFKNRFEAKGKKKVQKFSPFFSCDFECKEDALNCWKGRKKGEERRK